jgi:hypothetical protein
VGFSLPRDCAGLFAGMGVGMGVGHGAVILTCIFCSFTQAALEPAFGEKWCPCFQCSACREAFHGLGVQGVIGFDFD